MGENRKHRLFPKVLVILWVSLLRHGNDAQERLTPLQVRYLTNAARPTREMDAFTIGFFLA